MGINRVNKRGKERLEVRKRWPDGETFRRFFPNMKAAKDMLLEIEVSISKGTWRDFRETLAKPEGQPEEEPVVTVAGFADEYFESYCKAYNRSPDFKEHNLKVIKRILGSVAIDELGPEHAERFIRRRLKKVAPATINRGLAVLKNMASFAVQRRLLPSNPLAGFKMLPEEEHSLRIMTLAEERKLVASVVNANPVVGAYTAILGETGLRKSEGLRLTWNDVDLPGRRLTVRKSKSGKPRYVPLSTYALEWFMQLPRIQGQPWVFLSRVGTAIEDPRDPFDKGRRAAGLEWVRGFHDLRHFRATMWLQHGVDVHTVQRYLGHQRIETTMRYLHFVEDYAERAVRRAQELELQEATQLDLRGRQMGDSRGIETACRPRKSP